MTEYKFKVLKELTNDKQIQEFNKKAKNGNGNTFIIYFAHWCPHCQMMVPELAKLDEYLYKNKSLLKGNVARVSDEHIGKIKVFNEANGFPTIVLLDVNGEKKKDYMGERTMKGFVEFLKANGILVGSTQKGGMKNKTRVNKMRIHKTRKTRK